MTYRLTKDHLSVANCASKDCFQALMWCLTLLCTLIAFSWSPETLDATLVGYWDFDEGSGTTAVDSASTNDGALSGVASFTGSGKLDGAISFGGGQVAIPSAAISALDTNDEFSVSIWVNPTSFGSYKTVFDTAGRHASLFLNTATGGFVGAGGTSTSITFTPDSFSTSTWQHVVMTYDGASNISIFREGSANGTAAIGGTTFNQQWIIGNNPSGGGSAYSGSLDDLGLYDRVLTPGEIAVIPNLANELDLAYDLGQTNQLLDLFIAGSGSVVIGDYTWTPASSLGGSAGDVVNLGPEEFFVNLDGTAGVHGIVLQIPEPSSVLLLGLGALGLLRHTRRSCRNSK